MAGESSVCDSSFRQAPPSHFNTLSWTNVLQLPTISNLLLLWATDPLESWCETSKQAVAHLPQESKTPANVARTLLPGGKCCMSVCLGQLV